MHQATIPKTSAAWRPGSTTDDQAEQLVADLALAVLGCHLQAMDIVRSHLGRAFECAQCLSLHARTVRSIRPIKLARVHATAGQMSEIVLLPIVGGVPVTPSIDLHGLAIRHRDKFDRLPTVNLDDVDITYYALRLRTTRVKASIASLSGIDDFDKLETFVAEIVTNCLHPEPTYANSFDTAYDYLDLARGFVRLRQAPLAIICLNKAEMFLESCAKASGMDSYAGLIDDMKDRLSEIRRDLTARAS
jgi:hypothetical protein